MTEHRLTDPELQSLRNLGNEFEMAADEIVRLRAELAQPDTLRVPRQFSALTEIEAAMRRAFSLGQIYWQQVDNDNYKIAKRGEATMKMFNDLVDETLAIAAAPKE